MPAATCDLFCRVIDNHGDIGVCWRLARQLVEEYGFRLRLWLDDLDSLPPLCPDYATGALPALLDLTVHPWEAATVVTEAADLVIEAFACDLPEAYLQAMLQRQAAGQPSRWLNLEYLSAEDWVADCHNLLSTHPQTGLEKRFFFPGFTGATGGLLRENSLVAQRADFCQQPARQAVFWESLGIRPPAPEQFQVSLFCYATAPVAALLACWRDALTPLRCLVTAGQPTHAVRHWLEASGLPPDTRQVGNLELCFLPFLPQQQYDHLLWACDLNFVRGEDSFVRAQWAGKPFVWHIYQQQEEAHAIKLHAFLARYPATAALHEFWLAWNGLAEAPVDLNTGWRALREACPVQQKQHHDWLGQLLVQADLVQQIVKWQASADNRA